MNGLNERTSESRESKNKRQCQNQYVKLMKLLI